MLKINFTRRNLINKVYQNLGFSKNISSSLINDFFETIITELIKTNKIKISSFGTFSILNKKERIGRNPKTGVQALIFSRKAVKFKPSLSFKKKINQNE